MAAHTRAHQRYAVEVDASVHLDGEVIPARTKDLSRGGMCFQVGRPLPQGGEVNLGLALVFDEQSKSETITVRARVIWCTALGPTRHQVGTTFVGMTSQGRTYLDMFLRFLEEGLARQREIRAEDGQDGPDPDEEIFGS